MGRPTDEHRRKAKVEDRDPAAPLFDAMDRLHSRLDGVLSNLQGAASTAAQEVIVDDLRRGVLRGICMVSGLVALASTATAVTVAIGTIRTAEARALGWAERIDEERSRNFASRIDQRAAELASARVREAEARAAKAEAAATNARETVLAATGKGGDADVRELIGVLVTAPRSDLHVALRVLRHDDQNVRRLALKATEMRSGELMRMIGYLENGAR